MNISLLCRLLHAFFQKKRLKRRSTGSCHSPYSSGIPAIFGVYDFSMSLQLPFLFIPLFSKLCWGKSHGGLYKAPTKEERRKQKAKRRERSNQVY